MVSAATLPQGDHWWEYHETVGHYPLRDCAKSQRMENWAPDGLVVTIDRG